MELARAETMELADGAEDLVQRLSAGGESMSRGRFDRRLHGTDDDDLIREAQESSRDLVARARGVQARVDALALEHRLDVNDVRGEIEIDRRSGRPRLGQ